MSTSDLVRCSWANSDSLMSSYHDEEWGNPVRDSRLLWETLQLEGFQAGLSWSIILKRREAFQEAFNGFDPVVVAKFGEADIERMMNNAGIIRARAPGDGHSQKKRTMKWYAFEYTKAPAWTPGLSPFKKKLSCCG